MIEIKCNTTEKELLLLNFATKDSKCPFIGLCRDLPYYRTGMKCRECLENNIKWTITDANPEASEKFIFTEDEFFEAAARTAVKFYRPLENTENLSEFFKSTSFVTMLIYELLDKQYKEDK